MPWAAEGPGHGFTTGMPWLPFDEQATTRSVAGEDADPDSTLTFYRAALAARRALRPHLHDAVCWEDVPDGCIAFSRQCGEGRLKVVANFGSSEVRLPAPTGTEIEAASSSGVTMDGATLVLPAACTVWLRES